jgi:hypothetical protein
MLLPRMAALWDTRSPRSNPSNHDKETTTMKTHFRLILTLSAFVILLALGATAGVSLGDHAPLKDAAPSATIDSPDLTTPADECTFPVEQPNAADEAAGYQCPDGVPYCSRASQCADYCGGGFEMCAQGCCSCAG